MNDMAPQFTPAQILDAARRAEGEGRIDYALKFYRHLVEQFAHMPEGNIAVEALSRLQPPRFAEAPQLPPFPRGRVAYEGGQAGSPPPEAYPAGGGAAHREWRGRGSARGYVSRTDQTRRAGGTGHGFLVGRLLAMGLTWGGVLAFLTGLAIFGAVVGRVDAILDMMSIIPGFSGLITGGGLIGAGLGMILVGQAASALFTVANGVRDLVEIQSASQGEPRGTEQGRYQ